MTKSLILILTSFIFLAGCSPFGGDKESRRLVANGLTPKTLYEKAEDMVDAGSLDQAIDQYQIILSSYPGSKYAIQARLDIAFNLYKRKKYTRAIVELNKFIEKYPDLPSTPYAYYLKGVVAEVDSKGAFIELTEGIKGYLKVSEISQDRIEDASTALKQGTEVEVVITQIDKRARKISLSIKEKEFVEEKAVMENYKKQSPESNGSTIGDLLKEAKDK